MKISVIIPTYKEPEYLDLCIKSCIEGADNIDDIEIIVVVDGFYDINKTVLDKYKNKIKLIIFDENQGLCRGINVGVYNALYEWILIVGDDNVFPFQWDISLKTWKENYPNYNIIISPNQIEPRPSIFKQFVIQNLGETPETFRIKQYWDYAERVSENISDGKGWTLPIFMKKINFLKLGGWDENYPTNGIVADLDFFHKAELNGFEMIRDYSVHFYHFSSIAQGNHGQKQRIEEEGWKYSLYKWGYIIKNPIL